MWTNCLFFGLFYLHFLKTSLNQSKTDEFCLVYLRNTDDSLKRNVFSIDFTPSDDEEPLLEEREVVSQCNLLPHILKNKLKQDIEPETVSCVSCYCSASHTDNLSTDEHDSLRDSHDTRSLIRGLQSSDSGADLTECLKHDLETDWQKFWSINGEKLIWESWIAKYSAYINPDYLQYAQQQQQKPAERYNFEKRTLLTLDLENSTNNTQNSLRVSEDEDRKSESSFKNRTLIRNLSGSDDKLNGEVSEGWNPLSPVSIDCETEVEQLLSSRCGSHVSSLRTVDSMTNVTRMTISSLELSQSSHSSESFSSVSSVQSSLSSTSSEENEEDYQHQWNVLWKKHYEEELLRQYELFVQSWKETNINDQIGLTEFNNAVHVSPGHSVKQKRKKFSSSYNKGQNETFKPSIKLNHQIAQSLGHLLNNLRVSNSEENNQMEQEPVKSESENMQEEEQDEEEIIQMESMGLPTSFGTNSAKRERTEEAPSKSDKHYLNEDFESSRKRIKAAFNLLGLAFDDSNNTPIAGQVNYKMKHIRLQNRHLKLLRNESKPKHIHFDEDENGKIFPEPETEEEQPKFHGVLSDSSDYKLSSADEENVSTDFVSSDLVTTSPKIDEQDETCVPKRKKRKKKLLVPVEIKENTQLRKYWHRRFLLFSKFDEGIKLDEESWYSVTPEKIAKHIANRCKCNVIVDGFCGAGGNSIQFARVCQKVIAIDIDPKKIELAKNNAEVYGVADRIEFIVGDFFQLADGLKADAVFFSPPWGGPSYLNEIVYDLKSMLLPVPISKLLDAGRKITDNVAVFLPKNSNSFLLIDHTKKDGGVEIEQNFMNKKLVSITAYYNNLIKKT